ncbi:hypothetical protein L7F22_048123 [Adiantum nelumboides]|nr:hypothetical protein [Adiantum nelumboides]
MVTLRSTTPSSRQTPTKRIRDNDVIIIVDSDSSESEAEHPKITRRVCRNIKKDYEDKDKHFCLKRHSFSSPANKRLSVVSRDGEENELFCHKRRSPASRRLSVVSSDEEDNACRDATMAVSARFRMTQSCMPNLKVASNDKDDIREPSGRRRLFRLSSSPFNQKGSMHMQDKGSKMVLAKPSSAEPYVYRKEATMANIKVRRRLICSSSTSSAEASSTIETDTDNMPIGHRLLLQKSEEFSTASSSSARGIITRATRNAKENDSDAVNQQHRKLLLSSIPSPGHVSDKEAASSLLLSQNKCRDIIPLSVDRSLVASKQSVTNGTNGTDMSAAKRVKETLRRFNTYYLRCVQMKHDDKLGHNGKIIGPVPGINVGDQFFSRCEMVAIGLHCHWLGGIDTIPSSCKKKLGIARLPVASSIVLSGNYEDDIDNSEDVIYTGSGGNDLLGNKRQIADQVLKRGNLALKNNMEQDIPVRLVRGHKTKKSYTGKVYTYDGLYRVNDYWAEEGISGFTVYKYRLKRVEGQPLLTTNQVHFVSGHVIPTNITELKGHQQWLRGSANGFPSADFKYVTQTKVQKGVRKPIPAKGCNCEGECFDPYRCSCAVLNNRRFPYVAQNGGRLVEPMDVVYECGPHCACGPGCSNRVTQKGMQYRLEVFQTANKGWGVRSWDTIPAGAPVCQYFGVLMRTEDADDICDNEFIFELDCLQTIKGIGGRQVYFYRKTMGLDEDALKDVPEQPEYCIDAGSCGSVSRLINHSCDPNLFVQCVLNDHHDLSRPRIWFFAAETIRPLQELSYDYGYALDSVVKNGKVKILPCYCGAHACRKRLH